MRQPSKSQVADPYMAQTLSQSCVCNLSLQEAAPSRAASNGDPNSGKGDTIIGIPASRNKEQLVIMSKEDKTANDLLSRLRLTQQGWFTIYKRLFLTTCLINLVLFATALNGLLPYVQSRAALMSIANILALILCRNEAFLRLVFMLAVILLNHRNSSYDVPVCVKLGVTSFLQNLGGIHAGCGVSSMLWLSYGIAQMHPFSPGNPAIMLVAVTILVLLFASCLAAFPPLRHFHHNLFERVHRFVGWTSLALVWVFIVISSHRGPFSLARDEYFVTAAITFLVILPWLCVRRLPVQTIITSSRTVSIIKFPGGIKPGLIARISRSPLSEWHAFGVISDGEQSHMVLAGAVGDFTQDLVANPPSHMWIRSVHFAGLPYLANMYKKALFVATGSGIGVFLSFLLQQTKAEVYLIWVAKSIEETYGTEITEMVNKYPANKLTVCDTANGGRPNIQDLVVRTASEWSAEVVIVTSNPSGTKKVLEACHASNIPAFGPIWDS